MWLHLKRGPTTALLPPPIDERLNAIRGIEHRIVMMLMITTMTMMPMLAMVMVMCCLMIWLVRMFMSIRR